MNNFSKQFAIISKIKSMVKGRGSSKSAPASKVKDNAGMPEKFANRIQDSAYRLCNTKHSKDVYTPPYKVLAEQLGVEDNQIYCAAVFSLVRIAQNESQHKEAILNILNKSYQANKNNAEREKYLSHKIAELK